MPETEKTLEQCLQAYDEYAKVSGLFSKEEIKKALTIWLLQGTEKANYLTDSELDMPKDDANLQVVLGLQTCKTKGDVCKLLDDIRLHERVLLTKAVREMPV